MERKGGGKGEEVESTTQNVVMPARSRNLLKSQVGVESAGIILLLHITRTSLFHCSYVTADGRTDGRTAGVRPCAVRPYIGRAALPPSPTDGPTHGRSTEGGRNLCFG